MGREVKAAQNERERTVWGRGGGAGGVFWEKLELKSLIAQKGAQFQHLHFLFCHIFGILTRKLVHLRVAGITCTEVCCCVAFLSDKQNIDPIDR